MLGLDKRNREGRTKKKRRKTTGKVGQTSEEVQNHLKNTHQGKTIGNFNNKILKAFKICIYGH